MSRKRSALTYLTLVALAVGTWWLAEALIPEDTAEPKLRRGKIDYYSTDITRTVMTPEGQPKSLLFAAAMTHFKASDRTEMEKAVMTLYKPGASPWIIHAETAISLADASAVFLNGDVLITRETSRGEVFKIVTRNVKYDPNKSYAETAERATIFGAQDELSGTGMQVYFEPELKANLLADVRRKHEMQPGNPTKKRKS